MPMADEYPLCSNDEVEMEEDDDLRDDATRLFSVDLGDASVLNDAGDGDGVAASTDTHGTSSHGKRTSYWNDFEEIKENDIRVAAICKMCGKRYTARSATGTGHLLRHQKACRKKHDHDRRV
jgi:hypothetical protein